MVAVTIHRDFVAKENKVCCCFHFFPFYLSCSDWIGCHNLSFFNAEFHVNFFTFLFHLIKRLFSSSLLSAIKLISSPYLRLLIFLPTILIPACDSSILVFLMKHSAYKLNKQGDNKQPFLALFIEEGLLISPCCSLELCT